MKGSPITMSDSSTPTPSRTDHEDGSYEIYDGQEGSGPYVFTDLDTRRAGGLLQKGGTWVQRMEHEGAEDLGVRLLALGSLIESAGIVVAFPPGVLTAEGKLYGCDPPAGAGREQIEPYIVSDRQADLVAWFFCEVAEVIVKDETDEDMLEAARHLLMLASIIDSCSAVVAFPPNVSGLDITMAQCDSVADEVTA